MKRLTRLCCALTLLSGPAFADMNSDMNQFFDKLGFASNTTTPGVWQG